MIFMLTGVIVGFISAIRMGYPYDGLEWIGAILFSLFFAFVGLLAGVCLAALIGYAIPQRFEVENTVSLVALKDNSITSGHFFLGSGNINQEPEYFYMKKVGDGFKMEHIAVSNVVVFETSAEPKLVTYQSEFKSDIWFLIGLPLRERDAEIYIPKGSILKNFKIDLQ